jgi:transposase
MPAQRKYDEETQARAVRMYRDRLVEGGITQRSAMAEVGELLGINPATLRNWIRREDATGASSANSASSVSGAGESAAQELVRLRKENAKLRRANEILKTSSAFFAAAELDRQLGS